MGRPTSGDLTRIQKSLHQTDLDRTKARDDVPDRDMDAVSQATGTKPRTRLGHSASRPKSSYSATMKNRKMHNLLENQHIDEALTDYNNKLYNATANLENIRA